MLLLSTEDRFWASVDKTDAGCWLWVRPLDRGGYPVFFANGRRQMAHRYGYELLVGPIPEGLQIDHLCRVRHCVNPAHLEPVTARVNVMRSRGVAPAFAARTACGKGHAYTPASTRHYRGVRYCRICSAIWSRQYLTRKKVATA